MKIPLTEVLRQEQFFDMYVHKYINSRINILVEVFNPFMMEFDASIDKISDEHGTWVRKDYGELIGVTGDSVALLDTSKIGGELEFYELQKHYSLKDNTIRFSLEFNSFEELFKPWYIDENRHLNNFLEDVSGLVCNGETYDSILLIGWTYFKGNCVYSLSDNKKVIRIHEDIEEYKETLLIHSDGNVSIIGKASKFDNLPELFDLLCLLKLNIYALWTEKV